MSNENNILQQSIDSVNKYGSIAAAAKALKIPRKTLSTRYNKAIDRGYIAGTPQLSPEQEIGLDSKLKSVVKDKRELQKKYDELLRLFDNQSSRFNTIELFDERLQKTEYEKIKISQYTKASESTAVILCSDLHYEDVIDPNKVDNLNEYNPKIATQRFQKLFQNVLKLVEINRHGTTIKQCVVWLGGDLINGGIHDELKENNEISAIEASIEVFKLCVSAIDFLVEHGGFEKIIVVPSIGNHGRTTEKRRISTACENSYEWLIYNFLANKYEKSEIVNFKLSKGYFNWLNIYGYDLRFHHGDNIRYAGGIGGVCVPVNRAIAQWDRAQRAYLDIFGHWHQLISSDKFIINGSIVGYSPYAVSIKAAFEKPQQFMFLMSSKYGRTVQCPIFLE